MKSAEQTFEASIKKYGLLGKKDKVILGVSGGPDSVYMLCQFLRIKPAYGLRLVCAHFNHGLRVESDREEDAIRRLCARFKVKCVCEKKNVGDFFRGDSLEQTARYLRFDFFLKTSRQLRIKKIALAHHKDDLAETVLMRVIRGSGLKGLRGFLPKSKFKGVTVIRPLVDTEKKEVTRWLEENKIPYCVDKSNFSDKFLRNRIRMKIIPELKRTNPNIAETLAKLARNCAWDYDFIDRYAREQFFVLKKRETGNKICLDLNGLKKLHQSVFNNVIRFAIEELKGHMRNFDTRHLDEVRDLVKIRPPGSIVDLPGFSVKKEGVSLVIQSLIL